MFLLFIDVEIFEFFKGKNNIIKANATETGSFNTADN